MRLRRYKRRLWLRKGLGEFIRVSRAQDCKVRGQISNPSRRSVRVNVRFSLPPITLPLSDHAGSCYLIPR